MRLSRCLLHALWREIIATAVYLHNWTPHHSLGWKSLYEAFYDFTMSAEGVTGPRKPILHHLKAYGCHCYVLIKSAGDPDHPKKLRKLQPRAHIGFLVSYELMNIYRVWIPHKKKVILARDILFNEDKFYDGKPIQLTAELISELDEAVERVGVPPDVNQEDLQLRQDDAIVETDGDDQEEIPEDVNEHEDIDDEHFVMEKGLNTAEPTWESMVYPTLTCQLSQTSLWILISACPSNLKG